MYLQEWLELLRREKVRYIGHNAPRDPRADSRSWFWLCETWTLVLLESCL